MIIDAMRTDFLHQNESMKYINKLLANKEACLIHLNVHSPTVTMPRIKVNSLITLETLPPECNFHLIFYFSFLTFDLLFYLWSHK